MDTLCRVLIAEDEYIMQQGIKYLVNWEQEGFEIVGSASNGKEALALVEKLRPHVVLTDVVMPVMNGVELTAALRDRYPEIQVVVISGYSDFEYVRGTFQGGAVDYILKPTLSPQLLMDTMRRVAGRIPGLSLRRGEGTPEVCLGRVLAGFLSDGGDGPLRQTLPLEGFLLVGEHVGRAFGADRPAARRQSELLAECAAEELTEFPHLRLLTEEGILLLAVNFPAGSGEAAQAAVAALVRAVARAEPRTFFVASRPFAGLERLREVYQGPFLKDTERAFYYQGVPFLSAEALDLAAAAPRLNAERFSQLVADSRMDDALKLLCGFVDEAALARAPGELALKNLVQNAFYQIITRLEDLGLDPEGLAHLKRECLTKLQVCAWIESFGQAVVDILADLNAILETYAIGSKSDTMQSILAYLDTHYADPITLQSLAKEFNFSYSYLSSYFRAHHEEGFNDYLNKVRIRQAAALLQGGGQVALVCGQVGYGDQSYFTKIFKKYTGLTPGEYRRRAEREGRL